MTRNEFFAKLDARLNILNEQERKDIIDEYNSHIDFKMQDGKTEEEAIADFGNIDDLAQEILGAYHINSDGVWNRNGEYYIKKSVSFINQATEKLLSFSVKDMAKVLVEFLIVLTVILLISIPFTLIADEISYSLHFLPDPIDNIIRSVVELAFELVKIIVAFVVIYSFIKNRILGRNVEYPVFEHQDNIAENEDNFGEANFDVNTGKPLKKNFSSGVKKAGATTGSFLRGIFVWFLKIMLFAVVWLPAVILTIVNIVATVLLSILMFTHGIGLWGLCIIGLGCCIMGIGFTAWTTNILFGGKK